MNEFLFNIFGSVLLVKIVKVMAIIIILFIIKAILNKIILDKISSRLENRPYHNKANTVFSVVSNLINVVIYFIAITYILSIFNIDTSSILAVAGVGGMAIAFASQAVIKDVISGAFIMIENQFNIGDTVTVSGINGVVKSVGLRTTKLLDFDGKEVIIPNGVITTVINESVNEMRALVIVYITDNTPYDEVKEALQEACKTAFEQEGLFLEEPKVLGVDSFTEIGYTVRIQSNSINGTQFGAQRFLREQIIKTLQSKNIDFSNVIK